MHRRLINKKLLALLEDVETFLDEMKEVRDAAKGQDKLLYRKITSALDVSADRLNSVVMLMAEKPRGSPPSGPKGKESIDTD